MNEQELIRNAIDLRITADNLRNWIEAAADLDWPALYDECGDNYDERGDIGDVAEAAYWYASEYHGGQGSVEYRLLSAVSKLYTPGSCATGCEPESMAANIYDMLVEAKGRQVT